MGSLAEEIRNVIAASPLIEEGLARGIINLSALARQLRPELERRLHHPVEPGTIMMALRRARPEIRRRIGGGAASRQRLGDLGVRSYLFELTYRSSPETLACQQALLHRAKDLGRHFMTFTQGLLETTIVTSAELVPMVEEAFSGEELIARLEDLAAVVIRLPEETVQQPGVHYGVLKQLAWHGVNVVEVVSTYTEFTVVVARPDVDQAFSVLMKHMTPAEGP